MGLLFMWFSLAYLRACWDIVVLCFVFVLLMNCCLLNNVV